MLCGSYLTWKVSDHRWASSISSKLDCVCRKDVKQTWQYTYTHSQVCKSPASRLWFLLLYHLSLLSASEHVTCRFQTEKSSDFATPQSKRTLLQLVTGPLQIESVVDSGSLLTLLSSKQLILICSKSNQIKTGFTASCLCAFTPQSSCSFRPWQSILV